MLPRYSTILRFRHILNLSQNKYNSTSDVGNIRFERLLNKWMARYEDFVGLTLVKETQNNVILREAQFMTSQEERRQKQSGLADVQSRLKTITAELDKINKSDLRYLDIVKQEHSMIIEEQRILEEISNLEKHERESFSVLSTAVRASHEKERAQAEKTKYWSIIGSVIGAIIGITGSTVNNYIRMRQMKAIVDASVSSNEELKDISSKLCGSVQTQYNTVDGFIEDLRAVVDNKNNSNIKSMKSSLGDKSLLLQQTDRIIDTLARHEEFISKEMLDIKKIVGIHPRARNERDVVYIGPEVESLLHSMENNLEYKMKKTSIVMTVLVCLIVPVIFSLFKGS